VVWRGTWVEAQPVACNKNSKRISNEAQFIWVLGRSPTCRGCHMTSLAFMAARSEVGVLLVSKLDRPPEA
jgi:hypothetical protein